MVRNDRVTLTLRNDYDFRDNLFDSMTTEESSFDLSRYSEDSLTSDFSESGEFDCTS